MLRNESLLAIYEDPISCMHPSLFTILNLATYLDAYPDLLRRYRIVERRFSQVGTSFSDAPEVDNYVQVKITPGEFRDFENRQVFVINYQTSRYATRIISVVFHCWRLQALSRKVV